MVAFKQKANYGQMKSEGAKYDHIQVKDVAMYLYKHIIIWLCYIISPSAKYY